MSLFRAYARTTTLSLKDHFSRAVFLAAAQSIPTSHRLTSYRADVDGLRAIAVLSVVAFHASSRLPGGFVGVDVFFVISGYLISSMLHRDLHTGTFSFTDFYGRRIRRLAPTLIVVLSSLIGLGWFTMLANEYQSLGRHTAVGSLFLSNVLLWSEVGYFDTAASLKPLLHLWSLGIEEQFYLLWPVCLFLAWKHRGCVVGLLATLAGASFVLNVYWLDSAGASSFYLPHARLWELLIGATLAYAEFRRRPLIGPRYWARNLRAWSGLAMLGVSIATYDHTLPYPGWWALIPTIGTALLISAGGQTWVNHHLLAHPAMVAIGLVAYPLYLWHWALLTLVRLNGGGRTLKLAAIAAAFVLAWLTHIAIENPIRFAHFRDSCWRHAVPTLLVVLLLGVGAVGISIDHNEGFVNRFPEQVRYLANFRYDGGKTNADRRCFLLPEQDVSAFDPRCIEPRAPGHQKDLVLLWGDSFANRLYPGLQHLQLAQAFPLAQLSASACPPVLDVNVPYRARCRTINEYVISRVRELRPRNAILAANWPLYGPRLRERLRGTMRELRAAAVHRITVVGPLPIWPGPLPAALARHALLLTPPYVPDWMPGGLNPSIEAADADIRQISKEERVTYVSPIDVLCVARSCMTRLGPRPEELMAFDIGHLTPAGSRYLVNAVEPLLALR